MGHANYFRKGPNPIQNHEEPIQELKHVADIHAEGQYGPFTFPVIAKSDQDIFDAVADKSSWLSFFGYILKKITFR